MATTRWAISSSELNRNTCASTVISLLRQPPITTCFCVSFLTQLRLHSGSNNHYDGSHRRPLTTTSPVDTPLADRCVTAGHSTPIGRFMSSILSQFKLYFINCPDVESKDSSCAQRLFIPPSDVSSIVAILYAKAASLEHYLNSTDAVS
eukprot:scaffold80663_cov95-Cyclotella_meneghiniana.AAC.1